MISKEDFKALVEIVMQKTGKTQEELAEEMGYFKNYISEVMGPNGKLSSKFVSAFKMKFRESLENPNPEIKKGDNSPENTVPDLYHSLTGADIIKAILTLSENTSVLVNSNKSIVDTNRVVADTNSVLAGTNSILAQKLISESTIDKSTQRTIEETVAIVKGMKAYMADLVHSLTKVPPHEISQAINSKVSEEMRKGEKRGTRADGHK